MFITLNKEASIIMLKMQTFLATLQNLNCTSFDGNFQAHVTIVLLFKSSLPTGALVLYNEGSVCADG